ncbi:hypothetical protein RHGRI_035182 [Rhododendron griersonianum]|uniref:Uncharacterized protein n=1 Tax=Rhododendron griersonianum TaxID=479676 RepID=A0AAV6I4E5_9ERIC|nr:hypothetical protein RHGRI_035182 [Rhododendron griersonianum]
MALFNRLEVQETNMHMVASRDASGLCCSKGTTLSNKAGIRLSQLKLCCLGEAWQGIWSVRECDSARRLSRASCLGLDFTVGNPVPFKEWLLEWF